MTKWYPARSESEFPTPFGLWNGYRFAMYAELKMVKALISSSLSRDDVMKSHVRVYEFTEEGWSLIYDLPDGSRKSDCPLWDGVAPKTGRVSEAAVEAAIASIVGGQ